MANKYFYEFMSALKIRFRVFDEITICYTMFIYSFFTLIVDFELSISYNSQLESKEVEKDEAVTVL